VHLDLGRLGLARYVIAESVCYGYRPSFELRLEPRESRLGGLAVGFSVGSPYRGGRLDEQKVVRYLERAAEHSRRYRTTVDFEWRDSRRLGDPFGDRARIASLLEQLPELEGRSGQ
jgi:hypothetical protein